MSPPPFQPQSGGSSGAPLILPTGILAYPVPSWDLATVGVTPTLNRYEASKLVLGSATQVNSLCMVTSGAATAPTHWWFAIQPAAVSGTLAAPGTAISAFTADQGAAAIAANTLIKVAVTAPVTLPAGSYYAGFYFDGTTPPAIAGVNIFHALENLDFIGQAYHALGAGVTTPPNPNTLTTSGSAQIFVGIGT